MCIFRSPDCEQALPQMVHSKTRLPLPTPRPFLHAPGELPLAPSPTGLSLLRFSPTIAIGFSFRPPALLVKSATLVKSFKNNKELQFPILKTGW